MNTKIQSKGIVLIILLTAFSCSNSKREKESGLDELPNIVLLMGDDHGWDETGYNGHPFVKTPVLDEMAASVCASTGFIRDIRAVHQHEAVF